MGEQAPEQRLPAPGFSSTLGPDTLMTTTTKWNNTSISSSDHNRSAAHGSDGVAGHTSGSPAQYVCGRGGTLRGCNSSPLRPCGLGGETPSPGPAGRPGAAARHRPGLGGSLLAHTHTLAGQRARPSIARDRLIAD